MMGRKSSSIVLYGISIVILVCSLVLFRRTGSSYPAQLTQIEPTNNWSFVQKRQVSTRPDPLMGRVPGPSLLFPPEIGHQSRSGALSGRITASAGFPLGNVTVTALSVAGQGGRFTAITNPQGDFEFSDLPAGDYKLAPAHPGYQFWPPSLPVSTPSIHANASFIGVTCLPGISGCAVPPLLDPPFDPASFSGPVSDLLLGNAPGQGPGLVNAWFDHTTPTYREDGRLTRWDGLVFPSKGRQGVSWYDGHDGIDFSPFPGETATQVFAAASGTITMTVTGCEAGDFACGGYLGNQVWIDHGGGFATLYGHLDQVFVQDGETIVAGTERSRPLGLMGMTGNSRGVNPIHLHFGVYYDPEKSWKEGQKAIDPYGWKGAGADWRTDGGAGSMYLWKTSLVRQTAIGEQGGTLQSVSERIIVAFQGLASPVETQPGAVRLVETPASYPAASGWRPAGPAFSLEVLDSTNLNMPEALFSPSALVQVIYDPAATAHLDQAQLAISRWNDNRLAWEVQPGAVDQAQHVVQAKVSQPGRFELQGPLLCPQDTQEPDDVPRDATGLPKTRLSFRSLFDIPGDQDWYWFVAKRARRLQFQFTALSPGVIPVLEVYDFTGARLQASLEPSAGSQFEWTPPSNGAYFLRISAAPDSAFGCEASYEMEIRAGN